MRTAGLVGRTVTIAVRFADFTELFSEENFAVDFSICPHVNGDDVPGNTMAEAEAWAGAVLLVEPKGLSGAAHVKMSWKKTVTKVKGPPVVIEDRIRGRVERVVVTTRDSRSTRAPGVPALATGVPRWSHSRSLLPSPSKS